MALTKEQILTLTCLKEVDVKGVGSQKIFAIGAAIDDRGLEIKSYEDLAQLMSGMKEKAINKVNISNLNDAYQIARKIIEASSQAGIGLVGFYDEEFPDVLRKTVNEEGKLDPPLLLWYRGDFSITQLPGFAIIGTREATPEGIAGGTFLAGEFPEEGFDTYSDALIYSGKQSNVNNYVH